MHQQHRPDDPVDGMQRGAGPVGGHRLGGHRDVAQREAALALGVRVAVHDSRQNDRNPAIWQPGQDYRAADALHAARHPPTRARRGPGRLGPER
jgi:hypothetical protein